MTTYYPQLLESRILNDSRVDQSGGANGDVSNWDKSNPIILATQIGYNGKDTAASAYKLQWRDETDSPGGAFGDIASTGEVKWGSSSGSLSDGTALTQVNSRCTSQDAEMTWQNGLESVGDNLCPDAGTFDLGDDYYSELQWAISLADSQAGHQYTFQLYNNTQGAAVGVCGAQITILSAAVNVEAASVSLTATTYDAGINAELDLVPNAKALSLSTKTATVNAETNVEASVSERSISAHSPTVQLNVAVAAGAATLSSTTYAPTINAEVNVAATTDSITLTTYSASVSLGISVDGSLVSLSISPQAANVNAEANVNAGLGALTISGKQANINSETSIGASAVSLSLLAYSADVGAEASQTKRTSSAAVVHGYKKRKQMYNHCGKKHGRKSLWKYYL